MNFSTYSVMIPKRRIVLKTAFAYVCLTCFLSWYKFGDNVIQNFDKCVDINIPQERENRTYNIGILIPATTRTMKNPVFEQLSLTAICLPSIYRTIEPKYSYTIYIGINHGDYLQSVIKKLESKFDRVKTFIVSGKTFMQTVNAIARRAYEDGMDYFVRINDDTSFETKNWTTKGISILQNYIPPNIGVVGPTCHEGNVDILTHDMVHRTHLDIFDFYYPPYFKNSYADDWMTKVYNPCRATKVTSWVVKHHVKYHGTRYTLDGTKVSRLKITLQFDKERLNEYFSHLDD